MGKLSGKKKKHVGGRTGIENAKPKKSGEPHSKVIDKDMTVFIDMSQELKEEGNMLFQNRDFDGAIFKYEKALKLLPKNNIDLAYLHTNMAACYMQKGPGDFRKAIVECNLALDVSPKYGKALLNRARCFEALNQLDLALYDVKKVLRLEPNNLVANEIMERVRKILGEKSIQMDDEGIFLAPECKEPVCHSPKCKVVKEKNRNKKKKSRKTEDKAVAEEQHMTKNTKTEQKEIVEEHPIIPESKSSKTEDKAIVEEHPIIPESKSSKTEDKAIVEEQHEAQSSKTKGEVVVEEQHKAKSSETEDKTGVEEQNKAMEESVRTIKLVWREDIRCAQMPANCSVSQLREIARDRFPSLKAVLIKYKDLEGDLVTITTTEELRWAEASVNLQGSLRFFIAEVNPEHDPLFSHQSNNENPVQKHMIRQNNGSSYIDDWIIEFAQLLKNQVGFESDGYLELHNMGMKVYSEAIEETITSEDAQCLLDVAAEKFQEMAALAFFHWGNVHMSRARKRVPLTEDASTELVVDQVRKAYEWAQREYEEAGKKYNEALHIKSDFYEGLLALGQQQFEQAKLTWSFSVDSKVDLDDSSSMKVIDLFEHAQNNLAEGTDMWEKMEAQHLSEISNPGKSKKQLEKLGLDGIFKELSTDEAAELANNVRSQINILWGTVLYERSIIEFKLGNEIWEGYFEAAIERFELAGASEIDTGVMIKNHCSNENAQEGLGFKIDEIVQALNEMYDAKVWKSGLPSFRLESLLRRRVSKLHHILEHI